MILAALLGVVTVPIGFGFVAVGKPGGLKYALLFTAILFLTAVLGYRTKFRQGGDIRTVRSDGKSGTEVRYSSFAFWAQAVLVGLLAAVFLLAAVDFGLVLASFLVLAAAGRLRRGKLILSQQGSLGRSTSCLQRP